jgi:hypothetical protein
MSASGQTDKNDDWEFPCRLTGWRLLAGWAVRGLVTYAATIGLVVTLYWLVHAVLR